jgi:hypothetical protein
MQDSLFLDVLLTIAAAARWLQETSRAFKVDQGLESQLSTQMGGQGEYSNSKLDGLDRMSWKGKHC